MAFAGEYSYSGLSGWNPLKWFEKKVIRPVAKIVTPLLPVVGGVVAGPVGVALGTAAKTVTQTEQARKAASQAAGAQAEYDRQVAAAQAEYDKQVAAQQAAQVGMIPSQAGFFSKPSNLAMAATGILLFAYVPPLKKSQRGKGRRMKSREWRR